MGKCPWHVCIKRVPERRKGWSCSDCDRKTGGMLRAPAARFLFLLSFFSPFHRLGISVFKIQNTHFALCRCHYTPGIIPCWFSILNLLFFTWNTITYIFTIPFFLSLFCWNGGRMARKAYNIQAIDPRPSLQKKSRFRGWGNGGGLDTAIDNLLYQPFPWQPAEQGHRVAMHFAPVYFIYLLW